MILTQSVSAEPELYFGDVEVLDDGSKIVSLIVKDIKNLGSCDVNIKYIVSDAEVTGLTSGDGNNALTVQSGDIDNKAGLVQVIAWDVNTAHSNTVVLCNIAYNGNDSNPFKVNSAELFDYTNYNQIKHTGNNDIDTSSGKPSIDPIAIKATDNSTASVATVSGDDNDGISGFGLLTGLMVMLIAVQLLRKSK
ncbi:MAG TPA: hypothetical protein C5S50_04725 [Methanosarcinaceae archaeon]|nr:hypothetical protein [Methanosarcinaceae archaeon]